MNNNIMTKVLIKNARAIVRNLMSIDRPGLTFIQWLDEIYKVFACIDSDVIYFASIACMADLIKHGYTCSVDHQYCYTKLTGMSPVDRQMEATDLLGFRFIAARGTNTLPPFEGQYHPGRDVRDNRSIYQGLRTTDCSLP